VSQTRNANPVPYDLAINKYSSLWISDGKTSAEIANFRDIVNAKRR